MLFISGSYQNYQNRVVSNQLTHRGMEGECVGGDKWICWCVTGGIICTLDMLQSNRTFHLLKWEFQIRGDLYFSMILSGLCPPCLTLIEREQTRPLPSYRIKKMIKNELRLEISDLGVVFWSPCPTWQARLPRSWLAPFWEPPARLSSLHSQVPPIVPRSKIKKITSHLYSGG